MRVFLYIIAFLSLLVSSTKGDFVVTVGNSDSTNRSQPVTVVAGETVQVGIYLHSDLVVNPLTFTSLGMAFDISNQVWLLRWQHTRIQAFVNRFALTWALPYTGSLDISDPTEVDSSLVIAEGYDVLVDLTPSLPISLTPNGTQNTAIHIANVSFKVGASAQEGVYGFKFNPLAAFDGSVAGTANSSGRVACRSLPEPMVLHSTVYSNSSSGTWQPFSSGYCNRNCWMAS